MKMANETVVQYFNNLIKQENEYLSMFKERFERSPLLALEDALTATKAAANVYVFEKAKEIFRNAGPDAVKEYAYEQTSAFALLLADDQVPSDQVRTAQAQYKAWLKVEEVLDEEL